jgi:hypothetical protein
MKMLPMRPALVAILAMSLLAPGCAHFAPDKPAPQPEVVASGPPAPPAMPPPAPASTPLPKDTAQKPQVVTRIESSAAKAPAPAAKAPAAPAPVAAAQKPAAPPVAVPPAPAAPAALDLNALKEQLKETKAIGVFTKITLKNQVDDLLEQFREYYQGKAKTTLAELRRAYDLLMMKVLSLLQDADQKLASSIVSSREAIWGLLSDPKKFATLQS